jgi:hypothetical protein
VGNLISVSLDPTKEPRESPGEQKETVTKWTKPLRLMALTKREEAKSSKTPSRTLSSYKNR